MGRPELRGPGRRHIMHRRGIQPGIASNLARQHRLATASIRTCRVPTAPPEEELLVDSCFKRGNGEAVGYENVDEPVRLGAGDVGER